jgi:1-pyrroline-5-carboxylate dehydrogenase
MATVLDKLAPFANEPINMFRDEASKKALLDALQSVRATFGTEYDLIIGGKRVQSPAKSASRNPAKPAEVIGTVQSATVDQAKAAVDAAEAAFKTWSRTPAPRRADLVFKAAEAVRRRRFEFDALLVLEVGKSWIEADGDVAEGIDFLEYYGREMLRYDGVHPVTPIAGERNGMHYIPLGVGVIIPPWNFAFAIMVGMTAASIVTGNTVVLKPSSDSPVIAAKFVELLESVGLPPGVVNLITGSGGAIGDELVKHPRVRYVAFTGSKEIGLRVNQLAAQPQPGQIWIKRVVAEMGGKDSIVVAADADLDAAVEGVAQAAYGYQGQKCSACSRAIVEAPIYDEFIARLNERVKKISVGDPADPGNYMGPVINERSLEKIHRMSKQANAKGGSSRAAVASEAKVGSPNRPCSPISRRTASSHRKRSSVRCWR